MILNPLPTLCVNAFLQWYFLIRKGVELLKYKALRLNYVHVRYDKVTVLGIGRAKVGGGMHVERTNAGVAKGMQYE